MTMAFLRGVTDRVECMRVRPLLQPFLDGELDDVQRGRVADHLEACRRCGLAAATYRSLKERLGGLGQPADPDAVARLGEFVEQLADRDEREGGCCPGK